MDAQVVGLRTLSGRFARAGNKPAPDAYFDRYVAMEPELRQTIGGLTVSRDAIRRQRLLLDRDMAALSTAQRELTSVAAELEATDSELNIAIARRRDIVVQLVIVDQAVAGLQLAAATTQRLLDAVDAVLLETVLALRTAALAARSLVRQRVIVDRIRAETSAIAALAGGVPTDSAKVADASPPTSEAWQSLAVAWHRVERATTAIERLREAAG